MSFKKGDEINLRIESAAYEGKGIGKIDNIAIFVKNTAPGDLIRARIIKKKKKFCEAVLLEVLEAGPSRVEPVCRHALTCGGCSWQHVSYESQLGFKTNHVRDHLHRIGGFTGIEPKPALGSADQFAYRNKMEYTFGSRRWLSEDEIKDEGEIENKYFAVGLHVPGRYDRILNLQECHLQDPVSFEIMDYIRGFAIDNHIKPFDIHHKQGFFRNVMIRNSPVTGDLMVNLVTFRDDKKIMKNLAGALLDNFPEITTIVNNINDTASPTSEGRIEKVYYGPGYITDQIGDYSYEIDANTFFQTNTKQAERLYTVARDFARIRENDVIYDLYCGLGSLSLFVSQGALKVVGIELNEKSIIKARENALKNEAVNCVFESGDIKDAFGDALIEKHGMPDVLFTDPPRPGMHPKVIEKLLDLEIPRIVYVSCNSATLSRDLDMLRGKYEVQEVQPVDMFPHTYHIETVVRLELKTDR
ncbi:MAG: 23S rRNA (uracil(1939)-C(5))-methyltransferase RlmD [Balneolales bacterium]